MYISIVENRSGEEMLLRRLGPNETIDPRHHIKQWADSIGVTVAKSDGYIPRGCADYYAETRRTKKATGVCWASKDFYLESE